MSRVSYFLLSLSGLLLTPAFAEEPAAVPVPPQIPSAVLDGEALEPEITILKREDRTIHGVSNQRPTLHVEVGAPVGAHPTTWSTGMVMGSSTPVTRESGGCRCAPVGDFSLVGVVLR